MSKNKWSLITAALVLVVGLAVSAAAQRASVLERGGGAPPLPIETTLQIKVDALEVSDGNVGLDPTFGETVYGYTFLGQAGGDMQGSLVFSMNCAPAIFTPGESNLVSGGTWTFPVYMKPPKGLNTIFMGSLFGKLTDGKMAWDKSEVGEVYFNLTVEGGTMTWSGAKGHGIFRGTMVETKEGALLNGLLTITYATNQY